MFSINQKILNDGPVIFELALSKVILVDNQYFPWIILVPQKENVREFIDLDQESRITLMNEICLISQIMKEEFKPHKLNVAYLGNIVAQLHVHVVARYENDICWPTPVFGKDKKPYEQEKLANIVASLQNKLNANKS